MTANRVRAHIGFAACILATFGAVPAALGQQPATRARYSRVAPGPLPIRCQQADLVVVATCTKAHPAKRMELREPGNRFANKLPFRIYELAVSEVIKAPVTSTTRPASAEPSTQPARLRVFARAAPPVDPNGPVRPTLYRRPVVNLLPGKKYVLILHRLTGLDGTFVHSPADCVQAEEADLDRYRLAAQPSRWCWGKAQDGLQLAAWLDREAFGYVKHPRNAGPQPIYITGVLALRNTSQRTRRILLDPIDKPVAIEVTDSKGKTSALTVYPPHIRRKTIVTLSIQPGEFVFLTQYGKAGRSGMGLASKLLPDTYKLTASLTAKLPEDADQHERRPDVWAGTVSSKSVGFSLKEFSLKELKEHRRLPPQGATTLPSRTPSRRPQPVNLHD